MLFSCELDDFGDVEKLAEQVKMKTSNIQAVCHEYKGHSFPVSTHTAKSFPCAITKRVISTIYESNFLFVFQVKINDLFDSKVIKMNWTPLAVDADTVFFMVHPWFT